jgi:TRAP-type C4-dicarboxylate transport system permease large subunit
MNIIPLIVIVIAGFFISIAFLFETFYKQSKENYFEEDNYYFELYKTMKVIAFLELFVGVCLYIESPFPLLYPIENPSMEVVYHIIVFLLLLIFGAWLFEKLYEKLK